MPQTDKSVAVLTGMIVAALYVIMLVGFSRESYMRRDAAALADAASALRLADDAASRMCRIDRPVCGPGSWRANASASSFRAFSSVARELRNIRQE